MRVTVFVVLFVFWGMAAADAGIVFVGNKVTVPDTLTKEDIQMIYLGKRTTWDDKSRIYPILLTEKEMFPEFLGKYVNRHKNMYKKYWRRLVFTGRGTAPVAFENDELVVRYISAHKGTIGYVSSEFAFSKDDKAYVKIIKIIDRKK